MDVKLQKEETDLPTLRIAGPIDVNKKSVIKPSSTYLQNKLLEERKANKQLQEEVLALRKHVVLLEDGFQQKALKVTQLKNELTREKHETEASMRLFQEKVSALESSNDQLKRFIVALQEELTQLKERKKSLKVIQVVSETFGTLQTELVRELQDKVRETLSLAPEMLALRQVKSTGIDESLPVVVLCMQRVTKLYRDIIAERDPGKVVLMIVHHKQEHALPVHRSSQTLVGEEYAQLGGILDVAFLADKGMYTCEMNGTSVEKLAEFIKDFHQ